MRHLGDPAGDQVQVSVEGRTAYLTMRDPATVAAIEALIGRLVGESGPDNDTATIAATFWEGLSAVFARLVEELPGEPPTGDERMGDETPE